jgi:hypothetical protein
LSPTPLQDASKEGCDLVRTELDVGFLLQTLGGLFEAKCLECVEDQPHHIALLPTEEALLFIHAMFHFSASNFM